MKKICVFGDSVVKGVVFDENRGKYAILKDSFLNLVSKENDIQIKNYAKMGCTITQGLEILEEHKTEVREYDYTILEFGGNDCNLDWAAISEMPHISHNPKTLGGDFKDKYVKLIEQVKQSGGRPLMLTLPPLNAIRFFSWVSEGLSKENIMKFLGDVEYIYRWQELYSNMLFQISAATGVQIINIRDLFLQNKDYSSMLCIDGMHPNANGHRAISDMLCSVINNGGCR